VREEALAAVDERYRIAGVVAGELPLLVEREADARYFQSNDSRVRGACGKQRAKRSRIASSSPSRNARVT
jgi:hypothetical protein